MTGRGLEAGGQCSLHVALAVTVPLRRKSRAPGFQTSKWKLREKETVLIGKKRSRHSHIGLPGLGWGLLLQATLGTPL